MTTEESKLLTQEILERVYSTKPSEFRFITTWAEYKLFVKERRAIKLLVKALYNAADRLFKHYCQERNKGEDPFTKLVAYNQVQEIIKFYERELATLSDMIYEYNAYQMEGNLLYTILGGVRAEEDMKDFRA